MGSMADGYTETATATEELVYQALHFTVYISFKFQLPIKRSTIITPISQLRKYL